MIQALFVRKVFWALAASVILVIALAYLAFGQTAEAQVRGCQIFSGMTGEWPNDGGTFSNTKKMNFDAPQLTANYVKTCAWYNPANTNYQRQRIQPNVNDTYDGPGYYLEGWMWNTNLGWISTSCRDFGKMFPEPDPETGEPNPELFCQNSVNYRVYVTPEGELRGYAYSPKVGWILFHFVDGNPDWQQYKPTADINDVDGSNFAELEGYIWNPNVGYFKLDQGKFALRAINPFCENAKVVFPTGYEYADCPEANEPNYEYTAQPTIQCKVPGAPYPPYEWMRTDPKQEPGNPPSNFTVNSSTGLVHWPLSASYCSSRQGQEMKVRASIQADNIQQYGPYGHETENKVWDINLVDCVAPTVCSPEMFTIKDEQDNDVSQNKKYQSAYIGNTYYYEISVPVLPAANAWAPNPTFTKKSGPNGLRIVKSTKLNTAVIQWNNPQPMEGGDPYVVSIEVTNCSKRKCSFQYQLTVNGKNPTALSPCPTSMTVGYTYECAMEVDANQVDRATLPLEWRISSQFDNSLPAGLTMMLVDENGQRREVITTNETRSALAQLVDSNGALWSPPDNSYNGKSFSFQVQVKNAYGELQPPRTTTVTITDMAIPPVIEDDYQAQYGPGTFKYWRFPYEPNLPYFSVGYNLSEGTEPYLWQTQASGGATEYKDTNNDSDGQAESPSCDGDYQGSGRLGGCIVINHNGRFTFAPKYEDEGKAVLITNTVKNNLPADHEKRALYLENCGADCNPWQDQATVNNIIHGFKPVIKKEKVEAKMQGVFAYGYTRTFELKNLTRDCDNACAYTNSNNFDANLPILGTPKDVINNPVTSPLGFRDWRATFDNEADAGGFLLDAATGSISWTPTSSGWKRLTLTVKNDFGQADEVDIDVYVQAPPIIGNIANSYNCDVNTTFTKSVSVASSQPPVNDWGLSSVILRGQTYPEGKSLVVEDAGNGYKVNDAALTPQFFIRYIPNTVDLGADIKWESCKEDGGIGTSLEVTIFADNGTPAEPLRGTKTFTVNVLGTPQAATTVELDPFAQNRTVELGQTAFLSFKVKANTGVPTGPDGFNGEVQFFDDEEGNTTPNPNVTGDYNFISNYDQADPAKDGRTFFFDYTPSEDDLHGLNEKIYYINFQVTDDDDIDTDGNPDTDDLIAHLADVPGVPLPWIKVVRQITENPAEVDPWSENPASQVQGTVNVREDVYDPAGQSYTRIGDVQSSLSRDAILEKVLVLIKGVPSFLNGGTVGINGTKLVNSSGGYKLSNGAILYFKGGDVTIDDGLVTTDNALDWSGHQSIIVIGGNLYINDNLWPLLEKGTLDIVVLRNPDQKRGEAGNILVDKEVTNLKANIFADGALFNYDKDAQKTIGVNDYPLYMVAGTGCPISDYENYVDCMDGSETSTNLKHQMRLWGSLNSRNTIGGTKVDDNNHPTAFVLSTSVNGYGELVDERSRTIEEALAYDLKYFRFFHKNYKECTGVDAGKYKDQQGACEDYGHANLDVTDQVICRENMNDKAADDGKDTTFEVACNDPDTRNDAFVVEYQPYSVESKVFSVK